MPTVLLITDQERLRLLFTRLERGGILRLRVAPTLAQGEEEILARPPHYVFVENQISGGSGAVVVPLLRGLLPEGAEVILVARDAADADSCREVSGLFSLDLSQSDEAVLHSISAIIQRYAPSPPSHEPAQAAAASARELLFGGRAGEGSSAGLKRLLWLTPLTLAAIIGGVLAYRAREQAPNAAFRNPAEVVPVAAAPAPAGTGRSSSASPPEQGNGNRAAAVGPVSSGTAGAPALPNRAYLVRPGDTLLKILTKDFGYSYLDAVRSIPDLIRLNNLNGRDKIKPGQTISVPVPRTSTLQPE